MRKLILIGPDGVGENVAAAVAGAAERAGAGPARWAVLTEDVQAARNWLAAAKAVDAKTALLATTTVKDTVALLDDVDLVVIITGIAEEELDLAGQACAVLEGGEAGFVILVAARKKKTARDEDRLTDAICHLAQFGTVSPIVLGGPAERQASELWLYLAKRMERAAGMRTAPQRRSGIDRRRFPRWSFDALATLYHGERALPCRVHDVSAGGLGVFMETVPPAGAAVAVEVDGVGRVAGAVVHATGSHVGIRLTMPSVELIDLVRRLAKQIAARSAA